MAEIAVIATVVSTLATVAGTIASGAATATAAQAQMAAGNYAEAIGNAERDRAIQEGEAARKTAEFQAKQYELQGREERAAAQQEAFQLRRNKLAALSRLQARSASSGFSATDPTTLSIADEIERYGTLQEQMAMFGGASRASSLTSAAEGARYSGQTAYDSARYGGEISAYTGRARKNLSRSAAAGTILGGISNVASRVSSLSSPFSSGGYGSGFTPYRRGGSGGPLVTSRYG